MVSLPDVTVRLATEADIARLAPIDEATEAQFVEAGHLEFAGGGTISDSEAQAAIERGGLWVAEVADQVEGWLVLMRTGDELCVGQVAVSPEVQGLGIGTRLMAAAFERARNDGEATLVLSTQSDVAWNQPWYEALGFSVVAPADWTDAMRAETKAQQEVGLDWSTRVHMRAVVGEPSEG